jgi:hypothetical protein
MSTIDDVLPQSELWLVLELEMACTGTGDGFMKEMVDILRSYAR